MTRSGRAVLAVAFGTLMLLSAVVAAYAHAELVASEPADGAVLDRAPDRVRLTFNEAIEPDFFTLEVYSASRVRADRRDAQISAPNAAVLEAGLGDLAAGTYTVVWRVLSVDGHVVRGVFAFTVGAGSIPESALRIDLAEGAPYALGASARWLTFLSAMALVGGFAFVPLVLWPAWRGARQGNPDALRPAARRFLWVAWPAVILLLVLGLLSLLLQAAEATGSPLSEVLEGRAVTRLLSSTKYGALWLIRMGLVMGLLLMVAVIATEPRPVRWSRWVGVALGGAVLLTLSASGHASAVQGQTGIAIAADWLHFFAGSLWVGGLVQLALALPEVLAASDHNGRRLVLATLVRRFSGLAIASVSLLVFTGVYAGLIHVPSWQALLDTAYGAALSGKLIVAAPLLALGAFNLLVLHPRFVRAGRTRVGDSEDLSRRRLFRRLLFGEVILATSVLAVTGILAGLPPATAVSVEGRPFQDTQTVSGLVVTLEITPNQAGENLCVVTIQDQTGAPAAGVERVIVFVSHLEMQMGERDLTAQPVAEGRYEARGNHLSMGGRWLAEVRIRRAGLPEAAARFEPRVGAPPELTRTAFSPARILVLLVTDPSRERSLPVNLRLLAALAFLGVGIWQWRDKALPGVRGQVFRGIGAALAVAGLFLAGTSVADAYQRSLPNPVTVTPASLARGQGIYRQLCASCHGLSGRGDGVMGMALRPRPADFRVHMAAGHTDQELFNWVANGVDGTSMPGFKDQLSDEDRWHVINYIRTFANPQ